MSEHDCIFCKIAHKELSAYIVYEDEAYLAFLDIHPQTPGHTQVIPKKHFRWVWDVPTGRESSPNIGTYFEVAKKIAKAQQKAFGTEWILSKIVGDEIPHAHIWVFPGPNGVGDKKDFAENKKKIVAAF